AFGASEDDRQTCSLIGDMAIEACTRIINDRNELPRDRAEAFRNRGFAFSFKRDHDRAIADYTEAIRLDPKNSSAYFNRGAAWSEKGDLRRAIADQSQAIALDPKNAFAWDLRCLDRAKVNRDLSKALADCEESLRLAPNDSTHGSRGLVYL